MRASAVWVVLLAISCGGGPPAFDHPDDPEANDASDAGFGGEAGGGPRLLSDVGAPRKSDGHAGGGSGGSGSIEGGHDASMSERSDGPEGGRDASADNVRSPAPDATGDEPDGAATRVDATGPDRVESSVPSVDASSDDGIDGPLDAVDDAESEEGSSASDGANDSSAEACAACSIGVHLLITEVVTRPSGAEMIEIFNPTSVPIALVDYLLSDSHLYYKVATGSFTTASGSDFAARFPEGAAIEPGQYVVVALGNASGGAASFGAVYGQEPDFELRPTANGASDDPIVPNMQPAQAGSSIGATSSLTDAGEPVILFFYREGARVFDVDYLFYGTPSTSNPVVDKTGIAVAGWTYAADTPAILQHPVAPPDLGSLQRCVYDEPDENQTGGNGLAGHDETSENATAAFVAAPLAEDRTPGRPPPPGLCIR